MSSLQNIHSLSGVIEVVTGLHIGGGTGAMRIGGIDDPVVRCPRSHLPYIPGSSLKGKMRSLLEWYSGEVKDKPLTTHDYECAPDARKPLVKAILQLFGVAGDSSVESFGITRLAVRDSLLLDNVTVDSVITEEKAENSINRIKGTADSPRFFERVVPGVQFKLDITIKQLAGDDMGEHVQTLLLGLRMVELDSLGKSGSRGYGKVRFAELTLNGQSVQEKFAALQPFTQQAA